MKHYALLCTLLFCSLSTAAQRRTLENKNPQPPLQELSTVIQYLQQTGQQPQHENKKNDQEKDGDQEKKFQEAAAGMLGGVLTIIAGATTGNAMQIASGVAAVFGAAFWAGRGGIQDEELREINGVASKKSFRAMDRQLLINYQTAFGSRRMKN